MNGSPSFVRKPPPRDRRVARTREALVLALVHMVSVKRYDAITIDDLLKRAGVGRATFYSHFRGKDDLLRSSFLGMLEGFDRALDGAAGAGRIAPVRELFGHIGELASFRQALGRAGLLDRLTRAGIVHTSRMIETRLVARPAAVRHAVPAAARARALAGALFALLQWWIDTGARQSPAEMDAIFHAIAAQR
jgi:AcrR family transcriptional regulator